VARHDDRAIGAKGWHKRGSERDSERDTPDITIIYFSACTANAHNTHREITRDTQREAAAEARAAAASTTCPHADVRHVQAGTSQT
jgi:hypothetical protein